MYLSQFVLSIQGVKGLVRRTLVYEEEIVQCQWFFEVSHTKLSHLETDFETNRDYMYRLLNNEGQFLIIATLTSIITFKFLNGI